MLSTVIFRIQKPRKTLNTPPAASLTGENEIDFPNSAVFGRRDEIYTLATVFPDTVY